MTARKVMSRQDVFRLIEVIGFLTLAGKDVPEVRVDGDHAEPGDVADALAAFGRKVARYLEALPERDRALQPRVFGAEVLDVELQAADAQRGRFTECRFCAVAAHHGQTASLPASGR